MRTQSHNPPGSISGHDKRMNRGTVNITQDLCYNQAERADYNNGKSIEILGDGN